jgi:hypothetical protein
MRMREASGLPEMLGALEIDVRAAQSDIAQHAIIELQEQVSAPRPLPPTHKPAQQIREQLTWSSGADIAQLEQGFCIDTIFMYHWSKLFIGEDNESN